MQMIAKAVVALFLLATFIVINPSIALVIIFVVGGTYLAIYYYARRKIEALGSLRLAANRERFKSVSEIFGGKVGLRG